MSANNKASSKKLLELWGDNAVHQADDYLSSSYVNHQKPDAKHGVSDLSLDEWRNLVSEFHKGFTDVKMEVLHQVAEGDYVCSRWRMTAKNTGPFLTYEPTGKVTTWTGVHTDRYEGSTLMESWVDWDKYSWLEGMGLVG